MIQINPFSDERLEVFCTYCGENEPTTRDHVPSRVLLDKPYPDNLPVVPSCRKCNESFSMDEEYFVCLLECSRKGTTEIAEIGREKVKNILIRKEKLHERLISSMLKKDSDIFFEIESKRFTNVILKLARGHAKYENSEFQWNEPIKICIKPLTMMKETEVETFLSECKMNLLPEVGSRSLQRVFIDNRKISSLWIDVQPNNYRYSICYDNGRISVKMIIFEYLAAEVVWE